MVRIGQAEAAFGEQSPKGEASDGSKANFKLLGLNNEMPSTKRSEWGRAVWGASEALSLEQALSEILLLQQRHRGGSWRYDFWSQGVGSKRETPTWASSEVT